MLSRQGIIVDRHIQNLDTRYDTVNVDKYVVMPNHVHMIIEIQNFADISLSTVISLFKAGVTRECKFSIWQRSYHDHIIRGKEDYKTIWQYIDNNPAQWAMDKYYQDAVE